MVLMFDSLRPTRWLYRSIGEPSPLDYTAAVFVHAAPAAFFSPRTPNRRPLVPWTRFLLFLALHLLPVWYLLCLSVLPCANVRTRPDTFHCARCRASRATPGSIVGSPMLYPQSVGRPCASEQRFCRLLLTSCPSCAAFAGLYWHRSADGPVFALWIALGWHTRASAPAIGSPSAEVHAEGETGLQAARAFPPPEPSHANAC